jgi:hypothetical protein
MGMDTGAGGIRSVTRIMLVLLYPLGFIFALTSTALLESRLPRSANWNSGFLGLGLLGLTVLDQAAVSLSMSKRECKRRIARMEGVMLQARGNRPDRNVF